MKTNYIKLNELKDFLFDLWETTYFVRINGQVFNTGRTVLTYEDEAAIFEIFNITDKDFEHALWSIKKENIKTVNNKTVISNKYIKTTIDMKWDSSYWMKSKKLVRDVKEYLFDLWKTADYIKINGVSFCTEECFILFTLDKLTILNEGGFTEVASIYIKEISSLIIDEERVL